MISVSSRIEECADDIAYSLVVGDDKRIVIENYLHQHFGDALKEYDLHIDTISGDSYDTEDQAIS